MSVIFNWEGLLLRFTWCNAGWASAFSASGPMRPPARRPSVDLRTPRRLYLELLLMFMLACSDLNEIGLAFWLLCQRGCNRKEVAYPHQVSPRARGALATSGLISTPKPGLSSMVK